LAQINPAPAFMSSLTKLIREILPSHGKLFIENDAVAALASGTMGKLHGCMLIARTGTIAYGFTSDGREALVAGAGPVLDDWGRLVKRTTFMIVIQQN